MAGTDISISAEQLARMQAMTRTRERARIAAIIESRADTMNPTHAYMLADELRGDGVPLKLADPIADTLAQEIDALNGGVPVITHDPSSGVDEGDLPEVQHVDDETMALSMVAHRRRFGIQQRLDG